MLHRKRIGVSITFALVLVMLSGTIRLMSAEGQISRPPWEKTTLLLAFPQDVETALETPIFIQLEGSAPDGGHFAYRIYDRPDHGTISDFNTRTGTLVYTPDANFNGTDNFQFIVVNKLYYYSDAATVTITVSENEYDQSVLSDDEYDERNNSAGGKNWTFAIMFRDGLLEKGLDHNTIPESTSGISSYDAIQGPLGMTLKDTLDGYALAYGQTAWGKLTQGQKVWLLENFYDIAGLT